MGIANLPIVARRDRERAARAGALPSDRLDLRLHHDRLRLDDLGLRQRDREDAVLEGREVVGLHPRKRPLQGVRVLRLFEIDGERGWSCRTR